MKIKIELRNNNREGCKEPAGLGLGGQALLAFSIPFAPSTGHCTGYLCGRLYDKLGFLYFFGYIIALETAGADFEGNGGSPEFCLYLDQVWFPGPAGMILGMADLVTGHGVFSANIAGP